MAGNISGGSIGGGTVGGAFGGASAGVSDLFAAEGDKARAAGDLAEQQRYDLAAAYSGQEELFTAQSTAIKEAQQSREVTMGMGQTVSEVAGAGFKQSGSVLDILRSNAQQGALQSAVIGQQGLITEAGYNEQAASYESMAAAAGVAAAAANKAAEGSDIAAGLSFASSAANIATLGA
jgi:hypothetical protein